MPKDNLNIKDTLTRVALIHLIRQKVIETVTPAGPNLPPKVYIIIIIHFIAMAKYV